MECEDGVCELPMTREDKVADYLWARGLLNTTTVRNIEFGDMLAAVKSLRTTHDSLYDFMMMIGVTHHAGEKADAAVYESFLLQLAVAQLTLSEMAVLMDINLEEAVDRVHKALLASVPPDKEYVAPGLSDLLS